MSDAFDPYYRWLGIPPKDQPPDHYRLLSLERFETHADVIAEAADRQMAHLRTRQSGHHANLAAKLLNEIAAARVCLLSPAKKAAYDAQLAKSNQSQSQVSGGPRWGLIAAAVGFGVFACVLLFVVLRGGEQNHKTDSLADATGSSLSPANSTGKSEVDSQEIVAPGSELPDRPDEASNSSENPSVSKTSPKEIATGVWRPIENSQGRVKTAPAEIAKAIDPPESSHTSSEASPEKVAPPEIENPEASTAEATSTTIDPSVNITDEPEAPESAPAKLTTQSDALPTGQEVASYPLGKYPLACFAMCADGQRIVTRNTENQLSVIDLKAKHEIETLSGADLEIEHLAMVPDGRFFMASGLTADDDLAQLRTYRVDDARELTSLPSTNGTVTALAISFDNKLFATGHRLGIVSLNSTASDLPTIVLYARQRTAEITTLMFSSDNQQLVFGDRMGEVHVALIGARKPNVQQHLEAHDTPVHALGISSRGDLLMTAAADGSIALWSNWRGRDTAKAKLRFSTGALQPGSAALSPSGTLIASGGESGEITLWDATSGKPVARFVGHTGAIIGLSFLPDGQQLASASQDGTLRIWNCSLK